MGFSSSSIEKKREFSYTNTLLPHNSLNLMMWKQQSYFIILPMNLMVRKQQSKGLRASQYRFPLDPMKAADAGSSPIGGGRRGRLRRSSGRRKTGERSGLARLPRRRRVLPPSAAAATLLHTQPATPQLFKALTEENLRLHLQSRRSQHPRGQPSSGRRNPAPSYAAAAAIPMLPPDPTPLRSIGIEGKDGRTDSQAGVGYQLQVGLDWTPDLGSLSTIRDLGFGLDSG